MDNNISAVDEWIKYANKDLAAVNILISHSPLQLEIICYHCQQSAEKMLKAFLIYSGIQPAKTHNMIELLDGCEKIDNDFTKIFDNCNRLNPYSIQPRYPFGLEIDEAIMQLAVKDCEAIMEFINEKIKVII